MSLSQNFHKLNKDRLIEFLSLFLPLIQVKGLGALMPAQAIPGSIDEQFSSLIFAITTEPK